MEIISQRLYKRLYSIDKRQCVFCLFKSYWAVGPTRLFISDLPVLQIFDYKPHLYHSNRGIQWPQQSSYLVLNSKLYFTSPDTTVERLIRIRWPLSLPTYSPSWLHFNTCSWFLVIPTSLSIPFRTLYSNSIVNIYSGSFSGLSSVTTLWVVLVLREMIISIDQQVIFLKQDYPDSFFVVCGVA